MDYSLNVLIFIPITVVLLSVQDWPLERYLNFCKSIQLALVDPLAKLKKEKKEKKKKKEK